MSLSLVLAQQNRNVYSHDLKDPSESLSLTEEDV